tara:strand:+ start:4734 stop:6158 length:1425 start_codon:yes stop_codon:yes gene_type:complete
MNLREGAHIHLIAACGTAMGSLAAMLSEKGYLVTGSDTHIYPPMSTYLQEIGIELFEGFVPENLHNKPDLIVVGNAISRGNLELEAALNAAIPYTSLPEILRDLFIQGKRSVVVTGTHGKTTTTAMTAHLFSHCGLSPSFLVAGLTNNFSKPYHLGTGEHVIIEGDEYDSAYFAKWAKFFYYLPETLIINNIEFDHADIYTSLSEITKAFRQIVNMVPQRGLIIAHAADEAVADVLNLAHAPVQTVGIETDAFWRADIVSSTPQGTDFTLYRQNKDLGSFHLPMHGAYNVRNALASIAACHHAGVAPGSMQSGIASFKGVKRRQEVLGEWGNILLIDDFAHHPTAVEQTLQALATAYPQRRIWAVFEPASATNARSLFEDQYLNAFADADRVIIGKVPKPERARGDEPFSPQRFVDKLNSQGKKALYFSQAEEIVSHIEDHLQSGDLVLFMSNSGFSGTQQKLAARLQDKYEKR